MTIKIRNADQSAIELSNDDFRRLVREGVIQGDTPVWGRIFTDGEWWTAADLRMFHENSLVATLKGPHLLEEEARDRRQLAERRRVHELCNAHAAAWPGVLGLPDLSSYITGSSILGVARLWALPSFEPETVTTVVFTTTHLDITITRSPTSYSSSIPGIYRRRRADGTLEEITPDLFDPSKVTHDRHVLLYSDCPTLLASWPFFVTKAKTAVSCSTLCLDGIGFDHELLHDGVESGAMWSNPDPAEHHLQCDIIDAYTQLEQTVRKKSST